MSFNKHITYEIKRFFRKVCLKHIFHDLKINCIFNMQKRPSLQQRFAAEAGPAVCRIINFKPRL
jgi:hypothetical protein